VAENAGELARMRISDADRDRAASVLSDALAEGRLTADEHSQRLDAVYAAKTHADIVPIVSDLPGASAGLDAPAGPVVRPVGASSSDSPVRMVSVFGETSRRGRWRVPRAIGAISVFGHTELDLSEAVLPGKEITIKSVSILGDVRITVPPEMHVIDTGWALLGGREIAPDSAESARPDAPVLRISGISILGLATVRRAHRKRRELKESGSLEDPGIDAADG
jgi:uncharacterized protein DUF1707/cell wall-active antibiotic response 4TMS protein YvqF